MRKEFCFIFILALFTLFLSGCGERGRDDRSAGKPAGVNDVLRARIAETDAGPSAAKPISPSRGSSGAKPNEEAQAPAGRVDVDLTVLSKTVLFAKVREMIDMPQNYIGKTVKMTGEFIFFEDSGEGKRYFACIVWDKAGCCTEGIEFERRGDFVFPDDYPEMGSQITVTGVFDRYYEKYTPYFILRNAELR